MSDRMALAVILFTAVCTASLLLAGHEAYRRLADLLHAVMMAIAFPESVRAMKSEDRGEG